MYLNVHDTLFLISLSPGPYCAAVAEISKVFLQLVKRSIIAELFWRNCWYNFLFYCIYTIYDYHEFRFDVTLSDLEYFQEKAAANSRNSCLDILFYPFNNEWNPVELLQFHVSLFTIVLSDGPRRVNSVVYTVLIPGYRLWGYYAFI